MTGYIAQLEAEVARLDAWERNVLALAESGRLSDRVIDALVDLGPLGRDLVAALVDES